MMEAGKGILGKVKGKKKKKKAKGAGGAEGAGGGGGGQGGPDIAGSLSKIMDLAKGFGLGGK
ncbi:hypothetical protein IV102_00540 [bacterium]|nr:hypothetical protein [bacterium]